jgi:hypothetical protein
MAHKPNDLERAERQFDNAKRRLDDAAAQLALRAYRRALVRALPPATRKLAAELLSKLLAQVEGRLRIALVAQAISNRGRE